jgi:Holliday junction resolvase
MVKEKLLYKKGRMFEYKVKDTLEKDGYFVIRSAGSHSVADLVAIKPPNSINNKPTVMFVQCFTGNKTKSEILNFINICKNLGVIPCIATKKDKVSTIIYNEDTIKKYFNI